MFNVRHRHAISVRLVGAVLLLGASGCGEAADSEIAAEGDSVQTEASAATSTITVSCPNLSKASWIQAANGTVDLIAGQTTSFGAGIGGPTTTLECDFVPSVSPRILDHTVQLEPGSVPSACGAKATFSGTGQQIGGVPPFGGWQFKSTRVTATTTYTESTGACRLQIPVVGPPTAMKIHVSQACTPITNGYRCPATASPIN